MAIVWCGVDVSKRQLDVAIAGQHRTLTNDARGHARLVEWVRQVAGAAAVHVVVEASGGYEQPLLWHLHAAGLRVHLVEPKRVRAWAQAQGRRAKTDRIDAEVLRTYGEVCRPPAWQAPEAALQEMLWALGFLQLVQAMKGQCKNFREKLPYKPHCPAVVQVGSALLLEVQEMLEEWIFAMLQARLQAVPAWREAMQRLRTVPGVGERLAVYLTVFFLWWEVHTQGHGRVRALVAMLGLDPMTAVSGGRAVRPAHISRRGWPWLRGMVYMGAWNAARHPQNVLGQFYRRLRARGKCHKVAVVACSRKVLIWAYAVFRSGQKFDPQLAQPRNSAMPVHPVTPSQSTEDAMVA